MIASSSPSCQYLSIGSGGVTPGCGGSCRLRYTFGQGLLPACGTLPSQVALTRSQYVNWPGVRLNPAPCRVFVKASTLSRADQFACRDPAGLVAEPCALAPLSSV